MATTNWSGTLTYGATRWVEPRDLEELAALVVSSERVRAIGTRHSFSTVADTTGTHVSLGHLPTAVAVDPEAGTATVSAWSTYNEVAPLLHAQGVGLETMASLGHVSVAGAVSTATHGSGTTTGNLATAVRGLQFVDGTGDVVSLTRDTDPDLFPGAVVSLGALGVVTELTLDVVPTVPWHQREYVGLTGTALAADLDGVMASARSVSCFTRWQDDRVELLLHKDTRDPADDPDEVAGARRASDEERWDRRDEALTTRGGVPGPWYERLPHFRAGATPSVGRELQTELFVDPADGPAAIEALSAVGARLDDALVTSELRAIAADDLWLSPCFGRDRLGIHFTWVHDVDVVAPAVALVEEALAPFSPVPHWGKIATFERATLRRRYPRFDDAARLIERYDPHGRFRNDFLDGLFR